MATSLASKSVGPPDNSFTWYLQSGGVSLATGFPVALGDGTETPLWLDSNGVGFRNAAGFVSSFRCPNATANQTIEFHYTAGTGRVYPELVAVLQTDQTNSTTTPVSVPDFAVQLAASSLYEFEVILLVRVSGTTTSPRFTLYGPASQTDFVTYEVDDANATAVTLTAWGVSTGNGQNPPAADTTYAIRIRGMCRTTGSLPTSAVFVAIFSEVASVPVSIRAGSVMRFRKLN